MMTQLKFYARRDAIWGDAIELFAYSISPDTMRGVAQPTVFKMLTREEEIQEPRPWAVFDKESVQRLMDELWHAGFRPTEGSGSAGSLAATERHLADMRALVFRETVSGEVKMWKPTKSQIEDILKK